MAARREEFRARRDLLLRGLAELGWPCVKPRGAFYAFPEVENPDRVVDALLKRKVVTVPGDSFGPRGAGHVRLSYAVSQENLRGALELMREVV